DKGASPKTGACPQTSLSGPRTPPLTLGLQARLAEQGLNIAPHVTIIKNHALKSTKLETSRPCSQDKGASPKTAACPQTSLSGPRTPPLTLGLRARLAEQGLNIAPHVTIIKNQHSSSKLETSSPCSQDKGASPKTAACPQTSLSGPRTPPLTLGLRARLAEQGLNIAPHVTIIKNQHSSSKLETSSPCSQDKGASPKTGACPQTSLSGPRTPPLTLGLRARLAEQGLNIAPHVTIIKNQHSSSKLETSSPCSQDKGASPKTAACPQTSLSGPRTPPLTLGLRARLAEQGLNIAPHVTIIKNQHSSSKLETSSPCSQDKGASPKTGACPQTSLSGPRTPPLTLGLRARLAEQGLNIAPHVTIIKNHHSSSKLETSRPCSQDKGASPKTGACPQTSLSGPRTPPLTLGLRARLAEQGLNIAPHVTIIKNQHSSSKLETSSPCSQDKGASPKTGACPQTSLSGPRTPPLTLGLRARLAEQGLNIAPHVTIIKNQHSSSKLETSSPCSQDKGASPKTGACPQTSLSGPRTPPLTLGLRARLAEQGLNIAPHVTIIKNHHSSSKLETSSPCSQDKGASPKTGACPQTSLSGPRTPPLTLGLRARLAEQGLNIAPHVTIIKNHHSSSKLETSRPCSQDKGASPKTGACPQTSLSGPRTPPLTLGLRARLAEQGLNIAPHVTIIKNQHSSSKLETSSPCSQDKGASPKTGACPQTSLSGPRTPPLTLGLRARLAEQGLNIAPHVTIIKNHAFKSSKLETSRPCSQDKGASPKTGACPQTSLSGPRTPPLTLGLRARLAEQGLNIAPHVTIIKNQHSSSKLETSSPCSQDKGASPKTAACPQTSLSGPRTPPLTLGLRARLAQQGLNIAPHVTIIKNHALKSTKLETSRPCSQDKGASPKTAACPQTSLSGPRTPPLTLGLRARLAEQGLNIAPHVTIIKNMPKSTKLETSRPCSQDKGASPKTGACPQTSLSGPRTPPLTLGLRASLAEQGLNIAPHVTIIKNQHSHHHSHCSCGLTLPRKLRLVPAPADGRSSPAWLQLQLQPRVISAPDAARSSSGSSTLRPMDVPPRPTPARCGRET
ncbi:hypothetical protein GRJ2_003097100, partial [Grus japonensis]